MKVIDEILDGGDLPRDRARDLMADVMDGTLDQPQAAGLLVALRAKGVTSEEVAGFAEAMRQAARRVAVDLDRPLVDTCGTGGADVRTFSISTACAFVVAGAGAAAAKHGNRSHSSPCGSADLIEALGAPLEQTPEDVAGSLRETGVGFMFAPAFHPAMKQVVPVREALGIRTVFNILGPLTNPADVDRQVLGVYDPGLIDLMAGALAELGAERAFVLHGDPGMDEVGLAGTTTYARIEKGQITEGRVTPEEMGLPRADPKEVGPLEPGPTAAMVRDVLGGDRDGPRRDIVLANAAFGICAAGLVEEPADGVEVARQVIDEGKALERLEAFVAHARRRG